MSEAARHLNYWRNGLDDSRTQAEKDVCFKHVIFWASLIIQSGIQPAR